MGCPGVMGRVRQVLSRLVAERLNACSLRQAERRNAVATFDVCGTDIFDDGEAKLFAS